MTMLKPLVYQAAKAQGLDPVRFIKNAALEAAKMVGKG